MLCEAYQIKRCIAREHYQGSRGIGYGGKWIFKRGVSHELCKLVITGLKSGLQPNIFRQAQQGLDRPSIITTPYPIPLNTTIL